MLVAFFKSHMSLKTGVLEAMTALEKLANQSRCKAAQKVSIVDGIARLGDDFNMQTIPTRLKVYEVLLALLQSPVLQPRVQERLNDDSTLVTDLLNTFHLEKEPRPLIVCFNVQRELLRQFSLSDDNLKEIFESFSSFFPISLRRAPGVGDVTVEELKSALRRCFAASGNLASRSFPFLLDKLDHGDALIISVKVCEVMLPRKKRCSH
jgi:DNA repair/transcription protein MET18/MMS19